VIAAKCYERLESGEITLDELSADLAEEAVTISLSQPMQHSRASISDMHWQGIETLEAGQIGEPIAQKSRNGELVFRIYSLEEKICPVCPEYQELESLFHDQLVQQAMARERSAYIAELREKFEVEALYDVDGSAGQELFHLN